MLAVRILVPSIPACEALHSDFTARESNHVVPRYQRGAVSVWLASEARISGLRPERLCEPGVFRGSAHAPRAGGPGSARTCSCRVSTGRSTFRASGPWLAREPEDRRVRPCGHSFTDEVAPGLRIGRGEAGPAAGIEPALSRLRRERPYPQDLTGRMVPPEVGTSGGTGSCRLPQVPL